MIPFSAWSEADLQEAMFPVAYAENVRAMKRDRAPLGRGAVPVRYRERITGYMQPGQTYTARQIAEGLGADRMRISDALRLMGRAGLVHRDREAKGINPALWRLA